MIRLKSDISFFSLASMRRIVAAVKKIESLRITGDGVDFKQTPTSATAHIQQVRGGGGAFMYFVQEWDADDYLMCSPVPSDHENFDGDKLVPVAKWIDNQQSQYDGETITVDSVDYEFDYTDATERTETWDDGSEQTETQRLTQPYWIDAPILAIPWSASVPTAVDENDVRISIIELPYRQWAKKTES